MPLTYFDLLPSVEYDVAGNGKPAVVSDITRRFTVKQLVAQGSTIMYEYLVKDGERPDTIAFKYYKDSKLDWLVLLANEIHDRYFEWPLDQSSLDAFIRQKYGSASAAMASVQRYEWILQKRTTTRLADGTEVVEPERVLVVDQTTYSTLAPADRRTVSAFDREIEINDARRRIRLIDKRHVPYIISRVRELYET